MNILRNKELRRILLLSIMITVIFTFIGIRIEGRTVMLLVLQGLVLTTLFLLFTLSRYREIEKSTRTIVTIIGVILSTAMITAVTTFASSIQNYLLNNAISHTGDWHIMLDVNSIEDYNEIIKDEGISQVSVVQDGGYALLKDGINEYKPYLHIMELDQQAFNTLPIHLTNGKLPENSHEVVLSDHISSNGGVQFELGDEIELDVGKRTLNGYTLNQSNPFNHEEDGPAEEFQVDHPRTFTVVGFYERFPYEIEGFSAPGYSILTFADKLSTSNLSADNLTTDNPSVDGDTSQDTNISMYLKLKNPNKIYDFEHELLEKDLIDNFTYNDSVLTYQGVSNIGNFNIVLYGLAAIVITLIMVASIALIYNSFSISISERSKQFGLLSSVGATRKQLVNSVLFEALIIAGIGIPLGIGSGVLGIGITLYSLKDNFSRMFGDSITATLTLHVSVPSIIIAIIVSLITILISAYIPARRQKQVTTLDSIRQTSDIQLTAKNIKTSKLTRKIFGIEGELALKNLKRNKKRYRSTVFSLFISILLFISASAFSMYLTDSVKGVFEDYNYDIAYRIRDVESLSNDYKKALSDDYKKAYESIGDLDTITDSSIITNGYGQGVIPKNQLNESYYSQKISEGWIDEGQDLTASINLVVIDHESFSKYAYELGLDTRKFQNPDQITGILVNKHQTYDNTKERYINSPIFSDESEATIMVGDYEYENVEIPIVVGGFADTVPIGVPKYSSGDRIILIIDSEVIENPTSQENNIQGLDWYNDFAMYFKSENPSESAIEMETILKDLSLDYGAIDNLAKNEEDNRNVITIINVFAYGFIILMSLISIANVFNTITTNINLRRREFAMLKSVGMTNKGFNKMLNFECIFYGLKALTYGIPASIGVTYLIYVTIIQGIDTNFYLPINSIIISVFSVFLVVFVSMMYSMRKVRKENIIDALKNESF